MSFFGHFFRKKSAKEGKILMGKIGGKQGREKTFQSSDLYLSCMSRWFNNKTYQGNITDTK